MMRTRRFPAPSLVAAALCALLGGCTTWKAHGGSPAEAIRAHAGDDDRRVRLTLRDGSERTLVSLAVQGDSVVGHTEASPRQRVALPLADVARVAVRQVDAEETAANTLIGAFTVAVGLAAVVGLLLLLSGKDFGA